ncbi:MAG: lipopolysaccharide biosynthesis protein, partial [Collinsella sp.]
MVNAWWNRLLGAVYGGGFSTQEAEYEEHATRRDYLWNTLGTAVWGFAFPLLTIVSTQLVGAEEAGKFSIAFVTGTLIMIACNYGVRNFQVSDIDEKTSFASYQLNRWICGALALACGLVYSSARGYDAQMATIGLGVYLYKVIDGIADVYEGRLQQADKLYLAGMSQTLRSAGVIVVFSVALF